MGWLARKIDEWRGGPAYRALCQAQVRQEMAHIEKVNKLESERNDLAHHLHAANERNRLLSAFLHGDVQARCRAGCGSKTWDFELHLVNAPTGGQVLIAVCDECKRRKAREAEKAREAKQSTTKAEETTHAPAA
jgi:hypothetical protein